MRVQGAVWGKVRQGGVMVLSAFRLGVAVGALDVSDAPTFKVSAFHVCASWFCEVGGRFGLGDQSACGKLKLQGLGLRKTLKAGRLGLACRSGVRAPGSFPCLWWPAHQLCMPGEGAGLWGPPGTEKSELLFV